MEEFAPFFCFAPLFALLFIVPEALRYRRRAAVSEKQWCHGRRNNLFETGPEGPELED
jgi:hypothetical protein